jgi:hypothetical protein
VQATIDGNDAANITVPIIGDEFDRVATEHPLTLPVLFLMGFPPK